MSLLPKWIAEFEKALDSAPPLELYFLGEGYGESTVIHLEGHFTAVVDASGGSKTNITVELIKRLGIKNLTLVQLSHFHSDHHSGLSHLMDSIKVDSFARPMVHNYQEVAKILETFVFKNKATNSLPATSIFSLLAKVLDKSEGDWKEDPGAYKCLNESTDAIFQKTISGHEFKFGSIAPISSMSLKNVSKAVKLLASIKEKGLDYIGSQLVKDFDIEINNTSVVNRIIYGKSAILLTGDAENNVLSRLTPTYVLGKNADTKLLIVKIPHHGSTTSDHANLFHKDLVKGKKLISVIAPNFRHKLPETSVIEQYRKAGYSVYQTASVQKAIDVRDIQDNDPTGIVKISVFPNGESHCRVYGRAKEIFD